MASAVQARIHVSILDPLLPFLKAHAGLHNTFVRIQSLVDDGVASMENTVSKLLQTVLCAVSMRARIVLGVACWLAIARGFACLMVRSLAFKRCRYGTGGVVASIGHAVLLNCGESTVINAISGDIAVS